MIKIYAVLLLAVLASACSKVDAPKGPCYETTILGSYKGQDVPLDLALDQSCNGTFTDAATKCVIAFSFSHVQGVKGQLHVKYASNACGWTLNESMTYAYDTDSLGRVLTIDGYTWR